MDPEIEKQLEALIEEEPATKQKYKSTKGAADKRKQTSKVSIAKAREAKLAKHKREKEEEEFEFDVDSESESDDESKRIREKKMLRALRSMKEENEALKKKVKKKSSKPIKKTVIQVTAAQPVHPPTSEHQRSRLNTILDL
jgi:hypothetical protein